MARTKGNPVDILKAIVDRLVDQVEECNDMTCYLALSPDAVAQSAGDFTFVVAPLSGTFDQGYIEGGGQEQMKVDSGIVVKIHSDSHLDHVARDTAFLTAHGQNVLDVARRVLKALSCWSPVKDQNHITRDPLTPTSFVLAKSQSGLGAIEIDFACCFDWDLG